MTFSVKPSSKNGPYRCLVRETLNLQVEETSAAETAQHSAEAAAL